MSVNLQALQTNQPITYINKNEQAEKKAVNQSFSDQFKHALNELNQAQIETGVKTEMLVNGEIDQLHDVMIAAQKSSLSMSLAVEMQSKVIDAYNDIMRMQI